MAVSMVEHIRIKIISKGIATETQIEGCSDDEISQIMKQQKVDQLPEIYTQFLKHFGKDAGNLWKNTAFNCAALKNLKIAALRLLHQDGDPIVLPSDAFVFNMVEGIIFYYFRTNVDQADPPVFVYSEIEYTHEQIDDRLSDYLLNIW